MYLYKLIRIYLIDTTMKVVGVTDMHSLTFDYIQMETQILL